MRTFLNDPLLCINQFSKHLQILQLFALFKMYPYDEQVQDRRIYHYCISFVALNTTVQVLR